MGIQDLSNEEFEHYLEKQKEFLKAAITNILQHYDFMNIANVSVQEYGPEANEIVFRLTRGRGTRRNDTESVQRMVWSVMIKFFSASLAGPERRYESVARQIADIYAASLWVYPMKPREETNTSSRIDKPFRVC